MRRSLPATLLPLLLLPSACGQPSLLRTQSSGPPDPLLLISIDGFRPDYLDRGLTPTLAAPAHEGVRADSMQPAFPSLTFPNH